jgi:hypothetical protein
MLDARQDRACAKRDLGRKLPRKDAEIVSHLMTPHGEQIGNDRRLEERSEEGVPIRREERIEMVRGQIIVVDLIYQERPATDGDPPAAAYVFDHRDALVAWGAGR